MNDDTPVIRDTPTQSESPQSDAGGATATKKKRGKVSAKESAKAAAAAKSPKNCKQSIVTDTRITVQPDNNMWSERWTLDQCSVKAEVDMSFTASDRGGTDWSVKLVK